MRIGSLFSGVAGLDLAALQLFQSAEMAWHAEVNPAASTVLAHRWPAIPNLGDVTTLDWAHVPAVDVLTGGYPCQPFSNAGQRKGTDDERHLWPFVREAIRHLRPRYTLLENVSGHRSLGFDRVLADLAQDRMHVRWTSIRASDIGAPHHRERLFILVTDPDGGERYRDERAPRRSPVGGEVAAGCSAGLLAGADGVGFGQGAGQPGPGAPEVPADLSGLGALPDAAHDRRERCGTAWHGRPGSTHGDPGIEWGAYAAAVRRWERLTRPAPAPTEPNSNGRQHLSAAFAEWMMGLPAGWVTDPQLGLSRTDQLRCIGNGVVPQQAIAAFRSLIPHVFSLEGAAS